MKNRSVVAKAWGTGESLPTKGEHHGVVRMKDLFYALIMVSVTQVYLCIKIHRPVDQNSFTVYLL